MFNFRKSHQARIFKKIFPSFKEDFLFKNYTTFKVGGPAKYFLTVKTEEDLIKAVKTAKEMRLPFFILGKGSNLLVSDKGYRGLVISFQFSTFNFQKNKIIAGAGMTLRDLVILSEKKGLSGFEWAVGIPGTLGGAIYGNAGAFGKSMKGIIKAVEVLDTKKLEIKKYNQKECKFAYRDSIFKKKKNLIIVSAEIKLKKGKRKEIKEKIKKYLIYKKEFQPLNFPSAGSVFKNPEDFSAGWLIEHCGLKGKRIGNVIISEKHANFIINLGEGKAKDIVKLIKLIKKEVKRNFKINLKEEIQYLGF